MSRRADACFSRGCGLDLDATTFEVLARRYSTQLRSYADDRLRGGGGGFCGVSSLSDHGGW
jgi:hypothetical protein